MKVFHPFLAAGLPAPSLSRSQPRAQVIFGMAAWTLYILAFVLLYPVVRAAATPLAALPVALTAWFFGRRVGLLAGIFAIVLNIFLIGMASGQGLRISTRSVPSNIVFIVVGITIGWLE